MSNFERSSKLRLSEQNAKENFIFLFILEREYLRDKVAKLRLSEQNAKEKFIFLFILEREYLRDEVAKLVRFVVRPSDRREEKSRGEQNKSK